MPLPILGAGTSESGSNHSTFGALLHRIAVSSTAFDSNCFLEEVIPGILSPTFSAGGNRLLARKPEQQWLVRLGGPVLGPCLYGDQEL